MRTSPIILLVGRHCFDVFMTKLRSDPLIKLRKVEFRFNFLVFKQRPSFYVAYDSSTLEVKHVVLYTYHGSRFFTGSFAREAAHADLMWNIAATLASVPIARPLHIQKVAHRAKPRPDIGYSNLKKATEANRLKGHPGAKRSAELQRKLGYPILRKAKEANRLKGYPGAKRSAELQRKLGFPSLKKANIANRLKGHPGAKRSLEIQRKLGYPNLKKANITNRLMGHPGAKRSLEIQRKLGYPNLKKANIVNSLMGHPGLQKAQKKNRELGWPGAKKSLEIQRALGYPSLKKAWKRNRELGHPGLKKSIERQRKLGFPNLKKANIVNRLMGYPGSKKSVEIQRKLGFPNLKKATEASRLKGFPGLKKAQQKNRELGWPGAKKSLEIQRALGYPSLKKAQKRSCELGHPGLKAATEANILRGKESNEQKLYTLLKSKAVEYLLSHGLDFYTEERAGDIYDYFAKIHGYPRTWSRLSKREKSAYPKRLRSFHQNLTMWQESPDSFFNLSSTKKWRGLHSSAVWYDEKKAPFGLQYNDEQGPSNADQMEHEGFHCAVSIFWEKGFGGTNAHRKKFERFLMQVRRFFQDPLQVSVSNKHIEVSANNRLRPTGLRQRPEMEWVDTILEGGQVWRREIFV
ncbi:hypothetical protein CFAM422_008565 [Trichoderma lentiforme]|uniref:Uncharacterized protein n=1 Tax=Trichoderma lentiforme TaxID=1567552 RepID=A0A9P4X9M9_9HYPO|nr:hypothetical protein CFAM422_008565 [Trichoderma lentiforme]